MADAGVLLARRGAVQHARPQLHQRGPGMQKRQKAQPHTPKCGCGPLTLAQAKRRYFPAFVPEYPQARFPELPRLTAAQREALDLCDSVAAEEGVRLDMTLRPGDMQFIHNHQVSGSCAAAVELGMNLCRDTLWRW